MRPYRLALISNAVLFIHLGYYRESEYQWVFFELACAVVVLFFFVMVVQDRRLAQYDGEAEE